MSGRRFALALSMVVMASGIPGASGRADGVASGKQDGIPNSTIQEGLAISPIPVKQLNFSGKNPAMVALGSYLVNGTSDCAGCHSLPKFLPPGGPGSNPLAGDPFQGTPTTQSVSGRLAANFNTRHYLAGGRCFGSGTHAFMARNLTPDTNGLPQGLTLAEFIKVFRTGEDIHCEKYSSDPICAIGPETPVLQIMPWPSYHNMTDFDLEAIYTYLSAIPPATGCNTPANDVPGISPNGCPIITDNQHYTYTNTPDCPNPPPPQ
jgi:mono/diheme cytochrome c family protein